MKNSSTRIVFLSILLTFALSLIQCKKKESKPLAKYELELNQPDPALKPFDSSLVAPFFEKFPELKLYKEDLMKVYRNHKFNYLWHDNKGRKETAEVLYNRINSISSEGILQKVPYKEAFDSMLIKSSATDLTMELLFTSYYFFYTDKVLA